jgi:2-oxo-4-hydroxy-4-carboxy-5-ureidoimidazoline decarboxylase
MQNGAESNANAAQQPARRTLAEINSLDAEAFAKVVGPVFEGSPWIARQAWKRRPFASLEALHHVLCEAVLSASEGDQLALIQAHPDLAGRAAQTGILTAASAREQAGAGLNALTVAETALFESYNRQYREKFGFPFVICARLNRKEAMLQGFSRRLTHSRDQEIQTALQEIFKIAELRLGDLACPAPGRLTTHVLDTAHGCPARDVEIELWSLSGEKRTLLLRARTNAEGRTDEPLAAGDKLATGEYELVFGVGDYFEAFSPGTPRFLDWVPVRFCITDRHGVYHVPLVCSPWGYSTYRGS